MLIDVVRFIAFSKLFQIFSINMCWIFFFLSPRVQFVNTLKASDEKMSGT